MSEMLKKYGFIEGSSFEGLIAKAIDKIGGIGSGDSVAFMGVEALGMDPLEVVDFDNFESSSDSGDEESEDTASTVTIPNNEVWYTTADGSKLPETGFGISVISSVYTDKGVVTLDSDLTKIPDNAFIGKPLLSFVMPNSVTSIGYQSFQYCSALTSMTLSTSLKTIGKYSLSYCKSLTTLIIPDSVTTIEMHGIRNCESLTGITIPDSVTSIGNDAFSKCTGLTSVTIGKSVATIGNDAFYDCSSLTSITYNGTMEDWNSITKGSNWNHNVPASSVHCTDGDVAL